MRPRTLGAALALLLLSVPALTGCESLRQGLHDGESVRDDHKGDGGGSKTDEVLDVQSSQDKPKPFFKSTRLPGGLSSESRAIERDMGIY
jgi:hypothetical protein